MSKLAELLGKVNETTHQAVRIQALAAKMNTAPGLTLDDYNADLMSAHLEIVTDHLRMVQEMVSYLSRPIVETSSLWRNGSGQYETTKGFSFGAGSPIEVLVPDKYHLDSSHWERTRLQYDGRDYYLADYPDLPLKGLAVRVREGDHS